MFVRAAEWSALGIFLFVFGLSVGVMLADFKNAPEIDDAHDIKQKERA